MASDGMNIEQRQGMGSAGTQIAVQNNNYGLSAEDAGKMAFAIFNEYFPQLRREALDELYKLVSEKLGSINTGSIIPPKARIAVPTLQNASITEESEIRELYANLLANSMNSVVKDGVHPGFVEIIKQLNPDEAKILRYMSFHTTIPTITLRYEDEDGSGIEIVKNFSDAGETAACEFPMQINTYFDNLIRLGLLESSTFSSLTDKSRYEPIKNHQYISIFVEAAARQVKYNKAKLNEGYMQLTDFGKAFCDACMQVSGGAAAEIWPMPDSKHPDGEEIEAK